MKQQCSRTRKSKKLKRQKEGRRKKIRDDTTHDRNLYFFLFPFSLFLPGSAAEYRSGLFEVPAQQSAACGGGVLKLSSSE
jgi:hypothetical protein